MGPHVGRRPTGFGRDLAAQIILEFQQFYLMLKWSLCCESSSMPRLIILLMFLGGAKLTTLSKSGQFGTSQKRERDYETTLGYAIFSLSEIKVLYLPHFLSDQTHLTRYIIGQSLGECLTLFGIVVMTKYSISCSFQSMCMI